MPLPLGEDEAHLWFVRIDALGPSELAAFEQVLDDDERARIAGMALAARRLEQLVTRGLVRRVLSRYAAVAPEHWRFETTERGRPRAANEEARALDFNLSHGGGLVVCVVSAHRRVGVDVEAIADASRILELGDRAFSPREREELAALPSDARAERALERWTAKEAYAKALGLGAALPFAALDAFDERWQIAHVRPTPGHVLAVAAEREGAAAVRIVLRDLAQGGAQTLPSVPP